MDFNVPSNALPNTKRFCAADEIPLKASLELCMEHAHNQFLKSGQAKITMNERNFFIVYMPARPQRISCISQVEGFPQGFGMLTATTGCSLMTSLESVNEMKLCEGSKPWTLG